ncbi:MAG: hypothetical protein KDD42_03000 [Bdellovibrionales bacterium]|nr:hypothetical protein [Bdellovibrionales bacterium]
MLKLRVCAVVIGLVVGFSVAAHADDVVCPEGKVKTCFMDGESSECICVNPPESREIPEPALPEGYDESDEYTGPGGE